MASHISAKNLHRCILWQTASGRGWWVVLLSILLWWCVSVTAAACYSFKFFNAFECTTNKTVAHMKPSHWALWSPQFFFFYPFYPLTMWMDLFPNIVEMTLCIDSILHCWQKKMFFLFSVGDEAEIPSWKNERSGWKRRRWTWRS